MNTKLSTFMRHPIRILRIKILSDFFRTKWYEKVVDKNLCRAVDLQWLCAYGHTFPWNNPQDLNEKITWLLAKTDTGLWSAYADKYGVRDYISQKGYGKNLTKCYGVWNSADDINFDSLPEMFVIKCTHDCGSTYIIDKKVCNYAELKKKLKCHLEKKFGYETCEPHYLKIKPQIVAEEYLDDSNNSSSLIDYKFWCYNGHTDYVLVCYDRYREENGHVTSTRMVYDVNDWHPRKDMLSVDLQRQNFKPLPKPENFENMVSMAKDLSLGFPIVRVDLYNVNGKIYFGEMTFTSNCGRNTSYSNDALFSLGSQVDISNVKIIR